MLNNRRTNSIHIYTYIYIYIYIYIFIYIKHKTKQKRSYKKEKQTNSCNCRNKNECTLNGNCKVPNVFYKCAVSTKQTFKHFYLWISEGNWKERLYNHRQSFKDKKHKNSTALSSYLWGLKENHKQIYWKSIWNNIVKFSCKGILR